MDTTLKHDTMPATDTPADSTAHSPVSEAADLSEGRATALRLARLGLEKKALDVMLLDVRGMGENHSQRMESTRIAMFFFQL